MKITIIGSGSMWNENNSASYLIDDDILVDIPNGCCKNLFKLGIGPKKVNNILITHFHGDHYFDMPFYFLQKTKDIESVVSIFCDKEGKKKIKKLFKLAFPNSVDDIYNELKLNYVFSSKFNVGKYEVEKVLVDHGRMKPAFGYIFSFEDKCVGFTGDTSLCDNVKMMASKCDYLICDCMFIEGTPKHMGIDNLTQISKMYPKCKFVVSHLENDTRSLLIEKNIKNVIVPKDGQVINI